MGGIAARGHDQWHARREARAQARAAADHAIAANPQWQHPSYGEAPHAWPEAAPQPPQHAAEHRAPRIHRPDAPLMPEAPYAQPPEARGWGQPAPHPHVEPALHRAPQPAPQPVPQPAPFAPPPYDHPAEHWARPEERQGLLSRVPGFGRRRPEPDPAAWSNDWDGAENELIEPEMSPHAMAATPPTDDRIRTRITDVIRTRRHAKPVLRITADGQPMTQPQRPAEPPVAAPLRREPVLSAQPVPPAAAAPAPVPPQPQVQSQAQGYSFGFNAGQTVYPGAMPSAFDPGAAQAQDDFADDRYSPDYEDAYDEDPDLYEAPAPRPQPALNRRVVQTPKRAPAPSRQAKAEAQPSLPFEARAQAFELPPLSLLQDPKRVERFALSNEELEENARMLESVLEDYGVRGEIVSVRPGPVVTMYELEPAPGLKASRVIGLADDIARSMSALSARVSTVPGRSVIGIELPNVQREKVVLREILGARDFGDSNQRLPLALGKDIGGEAIVANLAKMPHLLIAGTTGSGKSVAINTMILSLLYKLTPDECRLIMIDPKMLELSVYDGIPHLLSPVVTDPKKAVVALKWVVGEMEERYRKMSKMGVRNIEGYNGRVREALNKGEMFKRTVQTGFDDETGDPVFETEEFAPELLPFIVVIVDEMADLMMVAGKEIEACIQRLAQMARASGIHLIMATQRPSVDVITGTIKANFPTRISFQVTSKIDSRTILGEQGAEQLLGMGDMLYMAGGGRISRIHGPFVSDEEVEEVVTHLKSFGPANYVSGVVEGPDGEREADIDAVLGLGDSGGEDQLYDQAVAIVARDRKCSTSYIQRKLGIGYNKAARLVEQMEDQGVVSQANHVGKREILVPEAQ
jgi:S-DNA-T family DNA segregation ATPase FtsK/SpoIIIE